MCTGGHASAAPSVCATAARGTQAATRTSAPGRLATRTIDAVHDGGGDALRRAQAGRGERPCRRTLAWPPAGDAGQHHGQHGEQGQRQQLGEWRGSARGPRGDHERGRVADDDQCGCERDRRPRPPGQERVANVAGDRTSHPRPPRAPSTRSRPADEHDGDHRRDERDDHQRDRRAHRRRQRHQDGDCYDGLHDLPGGALPGDGSQGEADITHVAAVADAAVNVAGDPAGEREVEEHRPVVRRDGSRKRQTEAEAARHDRPPPGTADGRQHADHRSCRQRRAVHRADTVEERAEAQAARRRRSTSRRQPQGAPTPRRSGQSCCPICSPVLPPGCAGRPTPNGFDPRYV